MGKGKGGEVELLMPIELQDGLDVIEGEANSLAQAIWCAHAAAVSEMGYEYIAGSLAVLLIAARQLHEKTAELSEKTEAILQGA